METTLKDKVKKLIKGIGKWTKFYREIPQVVLVQITNRDFKKISNNMGLSQTQCLQTFYKFSANLCNFIRL